MVEPLVAKVARPRLIDVAPRVRLFRQLDTLRQAHDVLWIAAPAGAGKTTLAVSYVEARSIPAMWYRVDEGDRYPEDLFFYLRLAAERLERSRRARVELPSFSPGVELAPFARRFFEALFARLPEGTLLVFDDYHLAPEGSRWQVAFEKALASIPPGVGVAVLSRRPPPPALARARVHGELGVLDATDLFLTESEVAALAERRRAKRGPAALTRAELHEIHAVTRGWTAGVALLLRKERPQDAATWGGVVDVQPDVQPIFDYFASAVFQDLTEEAQTLLLATACMPRFTAAHAERLAGVAGARAVLMSLYSSGFFLEREEADGAREVFRCHPLFRSFLSYRAERSLAAAELRALRVAAAALLREEGRGEEAFALLAQVGDGAGLRDLVLSSAPAMFAEGRVGLLEQWLAAVPAEVARESGWLTYWRARCALTTAASASHAGFAAALEMFLRENDGAGAYLAWAGAVSALTYELRAWQGQVIDTWLDRLTEVERVCPAFPSPDVGSEVAGALLMALTLAGAEPASVERWAARALMLAQNAADATVRVMTTSVLLLNYALRGASGPAAALVARLEQEHPGSSAGFLATVAVRAATTALAWHRGEPERAVAAAREGLALMGDRPVPMWQSALLVFGSWAALDRGDTAQVGRFLERLGELASSGTPLDISAYHVVRAREAVFRRDFDLAMSAIELSLDHARAMGFTYAVGVNLVILAYIAVERGERGRARVALEEAAQLDEEGRDPLVPFWRRILEADCALRDGDRDTAVAHLRSAFAVGRERQLHGIHCPSAPRLGELCRLALQEQIETEHVRGLIRRRRLTAEPPPVEVDDWPWPLRIRALGTLQVWRDEEEIPLGKARVLSLLLKTLVALGQNERGVPASQLIAALWPDADGDVATKSFEVALLRVRRRLGSEGARAVRLEGGRVSLDRSVCWTDVDALRDWLGKPEPPGVAELRHRLDRLAALYRGPLLDGDDEVPLLVALDERLRANVASAVLAACRGLERHGDFAAATSAYVRALEADPRMGDLLAGPAVRGLVERGRVHEARALIALCRQAGGAVGDDGAPLL